MNAIILNRDFQHPTDGWYHIEPKGEHLNAQAGVIQVVDNTAVEAIVNRFNAEADKPGFPGMLIDHEHFKHDAEKETIAYGWLMRLQNRADGVYGQVRWTSTGKAAVDGGDYRFFSTEYQPKEAVILNDGKPRRVRPMRLDGLTLTNDPNNKGARPITNRQKEFRQSAGAPEADTTVNPIKKMKNVSIRLGLSADASEDSVLAEVNKLMNRAETAERELQPLKNRNAELETTNKGLLEAQVDSDLERYKNRFKAEAKADWKAQLLTNRASTVKLLEGLPVIGETTKGNAPIHNRQGAATPKTEQPEGAEPTDADRAKAKAIKNRAQELTAANPRRGFQACWNQAQAEVEAQFAAK
jgi:phage I-like protein